MEITNFLNEMDYVDGIMIIDRHGKIRYSIRFNPRFENSFYLEDHESVINKNFLEVYPYIDPDESTMINCVNSGKPIYLKEQTFIDYNGRFMNTQNLTIPIIRSGKIIGAVELSKDITKIKERTKKRSHQEQIIVHNQKNLRRAKFSFDDIITSNTEMLRNIEKAKIISNNSSSVIVYGETGTGKELYVQSIHNYSDRKNKPFIVQNCAALPENLFESILFGSIKGAYTGAVDRPGLFEEANGGTLFLDEINLMPINLQSKLLRVLQDGRVRRVGDSKERLVDVRIISAMNIEPTEAIRLNQIRKDLFYRLSVVSLKLLPLRDRMEDILLYANHFIDMYNNKLHKDVIGISDEVEQLFLEYDWPGNVRELQHVIESSINFVTKDKIQLIHLPVYLSDKINKEKIEKDSIKFKKVSDLSCQSSLDEMLEEVEKQMIIKALKKTGGNISKAASILKVTRQRLHYRLSKYNIEYIEDY